MSNSEIIITRIGEIALQELGKVREATVMGSTSRGVFLRLSSGWVIFLSFEHYRGPLTLNIRGVPGKFNSLKNASSIRIYPDFIHFPSINLSLSTAQVKVWQPPIPAITMLSPYLWKDRLVTIGHLATERCKASQFTSWLPFILDRQVDPDRSLPDVYFRLARLKDACEKAQFSEIGDFLGALLGLGEGLTPSGDDLVIGFLLTINRYGERLFPGMDSKVINNCILARASHVTSALSTSLIACASLGQADERLIFALDGILTGQPDTADCFTALASWGNTSGFDALAGMGLCLMMKSPENL